MFNVELFLSFSNQKSLMNQKFWSVLRKDRKHKQNNEQQPTSFTNYNFMHILADKSFDTGLQTKHILRALDPEIAWLNA